MPIGQLVCLTLLAKLFLLANFCKITSNTWLKIRLKNIVRNDIENTFTVIFCYIILRDILGQKDDYDENYMYIFWFIILNLKILHNIFYLLGKQPYRSIVFAVSLCFTLYLIFIAHHLTDQKLANFTSQDRGLENFTKIILKILAFQQITAQWT